MRMLVEHPETELAPNVRLADPFENLHLGLAQDDRTCAIDTRVRITHPDHDADDTAPGDGSRAGGCTTVEGARFKSGVERRANDTVSPRAGVERGGDFRVMFTRAKRMPTPEELAARTYDRATDPCVIARRSACKLAFFDGETHPPLMLEAHLMRSITHLSEARRPCVRVPDSGLTVQSRRFRWCVVRACTPDSRQ